MIPTPKKQIDVAYVPNPKQALFHACGATEATYGGAKGGGKTCGLVMEALAYALEHPGANMYIFRETYPQLKETVIREWLARVPEELYRYNSTDHDCRIVNPQTGSFKGGSEIHFRYIASERDAMGYNGRSMDWIGIDELTFHEKLWVDVLLSCLRSPKGFPPRFRATCNPGGIGHAWVKARYIDGTRKGQRPYRDDLTGNTIAFIPAFVDDNAALMSMDPTYKRRLLMLPEALRRAYLEGDWDMFVGQYFTSWRHDVHVKDTPKDLRAWLDQTKNHKKFRSLDYGLDCTACYWIDIAPDGRLTVYRELYKSDLILSKAARTIVERTTDLETISYTVASPDLWNRRQDGGVPGEETMRLAGLTGLRKAADQRIPGWEHMAEWLEPYDDPNSGGQASNLVFFDCCQHAIEQIPSLIRDDGDPSDVSDKVEDHAGESIRYGLMSRPKPRIHHDSKQAEIEARFGSDSAEAVIFRKHNRDPRKKGVTLGRLGM